MSTPAILEQLQKRAQTTAPIGGTIKFKVDGNTVYVDGNGTDNVVSFKDEPADCEITISGDTLQQLTSGKINPMMAAMTGKIKIKGNMGLAMKMQSLLG